MTNKRLLVILIVFIVLGGIAAAGGTIFVVRDVEIRFANELQYLQDDEGALLNRFNHSTRNYTHGRNTLFGIDRSRITYIIENEDQGGDYRVRVTNIEVQFPNRLVITVRERYPVFQINIGAGQRKVFDNQLRFITSVQVREPIVNITGQINAPNIMSLQYGDHLDDLFVGANLEYLKYDRGFTEYMAREQLLKVHRLRDSANLFMARHNYEDAFTHMFLAIEFEAGPNERVDMIFIMRDRNLQVEIWGIGGFHSIAQIQDNAVFRLLMAHAFERVEATHYTGRFQVALVGGDVWLNHTPPVAHGENLAGEECA